MRRGETPPPKGSTSRPFLAADFVSAAQGCADGDIARHAFLQQQFRRLNHGFGVKARAHSGVEHGIGDGDDGHALVMGHEGAHDGAISRPSGTRCGV